MTTIAPHVGHAPIAPRVRLGVTNRLSGLAQGLASFVLALMLSMTIITITVAAVAQQPEFPHWSNQVLDLVLGDS